MQRRTFLATLFGSLTAKWFPSVPVVETVTVSSEKYSSYATYEDLTHIAESLGYRAGLHVDTQMTKVFKEWFPDVELN